MSLEAIHPSLLVFSYPDGNLDTAFEGEYGGVFETLPAENPGVIDHCTVGLELAEYVFVSFVDFNNLANSPNGHLSRKSILFTDAIVDELLECPVISDPVVVGYLGYVVARLVKPLHSMKQEIVLLIIWGEFYQKRKLHQHTEGITSCLIVTFSFLPPYK